MIRFLTKRKAESGKRIESRRGAGASRCARTQSEIRIPKSQIQRSAFTLIELLVSISILAILGSAVLFASFEASEAARRAATRTRINTINTLLMELWDSYATRRAPFDEDRYTQNVDPRIRNLVAAQYRLRAHRVLMRIDMPDRWTDITLTDTENPRQPGTPPLLNNRTALSNAYLRRYQDIYRTTTAPDRLVENQSAECLYLIVMLATADGEARSFFKESDIGDTDGDGALEFLDGWGQPIHFVRWAPGFVESSELMTGDPVNDHDPFDVFRRDLDAFRLVPLIYSPGPDGISDIRMAATFVSSNNPYESTSSNAVEWLGEPRDAERDGNGEENWHDNIHNHIADVKGL